MKEYFNVGDIVTEEELSNLCVGIKFKSKDPVIVYRNLDENKRCKQYKIIDIFDGTFTVELDEIKRGGGKLTRKGYHNKILIIVDAIQTS